MYEKSIDNYFKSIVIAYILITRKILTNNQKKISYHKNDKQLIDMSRSHI